MTDSNNVNLKKLQKDIGDIKKAIPNIASTLMENSAQINALWDLESEKTKRELSDKAGLATKQLKAIKESNNQFDKKLKNKVVYLKKEINRFEEIYSTDPEINPPIREIIVHLRNKKQVTITPSDKKHPNGIGKDMKDYADLRTQLFISPQLAGYYFPELNTYRDYLNLCQNPDSFDHGTLYLTAKKIDDTD